MAPPVLDATPAGSAANSYETVAEADVYFSGRLPLDPAWEDNDTDTKTMLLIMGTRTLDAAFRGQRILVPATGSVPAYWKVGRKWNGSASTSTQKLAWPRIGLFHDNGAAIGANEIPWELKDAESELAGQLGIRDRTLDNPIIAQGITSAKAGSASVTFRDSSAIFPFTIPQAVLDLIPPSWYTEEWIEPVEQFDFATVLP